MVVNAVGKEDSFCKDGKVLEVFAGAVAFVFAQYVFNDVADGKVFCAVLVPGYVAAVFGGF